MTITGTAAQINAALAGLSYTGNLNFNGSDTLTVTTGDGTTQDIDTIAITVNPLADAPVNTVPGAQTVNEDTTLPIAGVSVADLDVGTLTTTLTVTSGTLNVTAGAGVTGYKKNDLDRCHQQRIHRIHELGAAGRSEYGRRIRGLHQQRCANGDYDHRR